MCGRRLSSFASCSKTPTTNWKTNSLPAGEAEATSRVVRLPRFCVGAGTSSGPYFDSETWVSLTLTTVLESRVCESAATGNGVRRSPSPTEKHNEPIMTANNAAVITNEFVTRENNFIARHYNNRLARFPNTCPIRPPKRPMPLDYICANSRCVASMRFSCCW